MNFTTQILQDDVRILRFTLGGGLFDGEVFLKNTTGWQVVNLLRDLVDGSTVGNVLAAERIVLDAGQHTAEEFRDALASSGILDVIESVQDRAKIVIPVYSLYSLQISGEIPYWESERKHQEHTILNWSAVFPDSSLVLVVNPIIPSSSQLALLYQSISNGLLFAPDVSGGLATIEEISSALEEEIFRPNDGSVLIQTQPHSFYAATKEAADLYRSMFGVDLAVQLVGVKKTTMIPFSVRVHEVASTPPDQARKIVSILPPPADYSGLQAQLSYWAERQKSATRLPADAEELLNSASSAAAAEETQKQAVLESEQNSDVELTPELDGDGEATLNSNVGLVMLTDTSVEEDAAVELPPSPKVSPQALARPDEVTYPTQIIHVLPTQSRFEEQSADQLTSDVKRIFRTSIAQTKEQTTQKKVVQRKKIKKQSKKRRALFYIGIVFVSVGMGLGALLGWFKISVDKTQAELSRVIADSVITDSKVQISWGSYQTRVEMLRPLHAFFKSVLALGVVESADDLIQTADMLDTLEKSTLTANQSLISVFNSVWRTDAGSVGELSKTMISDVNSHRQVLNDFQQIAQLTDGKSVLGATTQSSPEKTAALLEKIAPKLGSIFGESESKNYVVVLQNSQELRPTGGFIEAVAMISFVNGSISGVETYSSYQLDKRMQTHISPPEDLQQILGEQQWWLRDANWYPDGPKTAEQIARFAHSTIGKEPDGVIILNTLSLPAVLAATGPIELPEFSEVLTEKNIAERLEHHTELPQQISDEKVEYRGALLKALFAKFGALGDEQALALLAALHQELDNRQLLLYSADEGVQQAFSQFGWVGSFAFPTCPTPFSEHHCETDGIAQVETNVGVNRSNAYIERKLEHSIELSPTEAKHTHTITWENRAQTQAWPKGDYRVYLRLYIPRQVGVVNATLNGNPISQDEIRRSSSQNNEEIGMVVVVPIKEKATLAVTYSTPLSLSPDPASYLFYQVRQPGTTTNLAPVSISYPNGWRVATIAPEPESLSPILVFGSESAPHTVQIVQFTQAE